RARCTAREFAPSHRRLGDFAAVEERLADWDVRSWGEIRIGFGPPLAEVDQTAPPVAERRRARGALDLGGQLRRHAPLVAGLSFAALGFLSLLVYACVLDRGVNALRPKARRVILRVSGLALIAFGGRLAADVK